MSTRAEAKDANSNQRQLSQRRPATLWLSTLACSALAPAELELAGGTADQVDRFNAAIDPDGNSASLASG